MASRNICGFVRVLHKGLHFNTLSSIIHMAARTANHHHGHSWLLSTFHRAVMSDAKNGSLSVTNQTTEEGVMPPFLDLDRSPSSVRQNMEDVKRKVSVFIKGTVVQMKAVELYAAIRKMDQDEILCLVGNSNDQLDKTHLALCLKRLFKQTWNERRNDNYKELVASIRKDERFQLLCVLIAQKARHLEPSIAADMVNFMSHLGYDSSHPVMHHLLRLSIHFINDLALDQLVLTGHHLSNMTSDVLTVTLMDAIKILCQGRGHQIGMLTPWHRIVLIDLFGAELPYADQLLQDMWKEREVLGLHFSVLMLKALVNSELRHRWLEMWCPESIYARVAMVTADNAVAIADSCQRLGLYSAELFHELGQLEMLSLNDQMQVWSCFIDHGYLHGQLTKSVMAGLMDCDLERLNLPWASVARLLKHLADGDMELSSGFSENLEQWIEKNVDMMLEQLAPVDILDLVLSAVTLGVRPNRNTLSPLFTLELLAKCPADDGKGSTISAAEKILLINDATKFLPSNDEFLVKVREQNGALPRRTTSPLSGAVRSLWPQAQHSYLTESGLFVDHLIEIDRRRRVVILFWPSSCFWRNTGQMKAPQRVFAQLLQKDGYNVVMVKAVQWQKTGERERFEFLRRKVDNAKDDQDLFIW